MQQKLSFPLIFNQTCQFIRSRFLQIIVISIILGILYSLIYDFFISNLIINTINEQMFIGNTAISSLFAAAMSSIIKMALMVMILNIINLSINIFAVYKLSSSEKININSIVSKITSSMLKLIGFNLIYLLISLFVGILFGLLCLMLSLIGSNQLTTVFMIFCILIMVIYITTVVYFFMGSIVAPTSKSFFEIFIETHRLFRRYWIPGCFIVIITYICMLLVNFLLIDFSNSNYVLAPFNNFINIFLIYFFHQMFTFLTKKELVSENGDTTNNKLLI